MKNLIIITLICFLLMPAFAFAVEEADVSGSISTIVRMVDGERDSAKFQEYREIPDGVSADARLNYIKGSYFLELKVQDAAEDDQRLRFTSGRYGKYKIEIIYDKLPHRFSFDARTLYAGTGAGNLLLSDRLQSDLQGTRAASDLNGDGAVDGRDHVINLANAVNSYMDGAFSTDLELFRKTGKVDVDVSAFEPLNIHAEFRREERQGTRPISGAFGFGNVLEIPEPIDYDTTELRLSAEYSKKNYYLNASYCLSVFENNISALSWDNPFRVSDSTTAGAYSNPSAGSSTTTPPFIYANDGGKEGLIDLYPDNRYHNITLAGSIMELPMKSRVSATASWGWMNQDDDLVPYTTNTSIVPGAADDPPFDASDPASLPVRSLDSEVSTSLYNILLTSKPAEKLRLKARYRYYEYDNDTETLEFPGWVRTDAVWEELFGGVHVENKPSGFKKSTFSIDIGYDLIKSTTVTLGYTFEGTKRVHREVDEADDNIFGIFVKSMPVSWFDLRASYERASRDGDYDFTAPLEPAGALPDGTPTYAQIPLLRKYDEADRERDKVQLIAAFYPSEPLTVTGSFIYKKDDFDESVFGLVEDKHNIYSLDADYAVTDKLSVSAFISHESIKNKQKDRQWNPGGGIGDPYSRETSVESNSNWDAENKDKTNTFGAGLNFALMPKKLDLVLNYTYSKSDGRIALSSPLGTSANDLNAFVPLDFTEVDDIKLQSLGAKLKWHVKKGFSAALGFMWEKFDVKDFDNAGFTFVPTQASGAFNGAIFMGTLPKDYDVSVIYAKLTYNF